MEVSIMRIIISPAKKMNSDPDSLPWMDLPMFLPQTRLLFDRLQEMGDSELKKLWKCNDQIAQLNIRRLRHMELEKNLTPAILAYEGIQYRYMAPGVFSDSEFQYIQEHLRILSGFYGMLRPLDGVTPYRLEMQAKLPVNGHRDLYGYWGDSIANQLFAETDCIVNLASREYSLCISPYVSESVRFVTCVFAQELNGKLIEKGTLCKMARGEMVRFMAQNQISNPEQMKSFDRLSYRFSEEHSNPTIYVFLCP